MTRRPLSLFLGLLLAVGACRLVELRISRRNQRALAARGAAPLPEPVFGAMVALHTGVLIAAALEVAAAAPARDARRWRSRRWCCWRSRTCCGSG